MQACSDGNVNAVTSSAFQANYDRIFDWEQRAARAIAHSVVTPRPIGVWEFLIPLIFIFSFMKTRQARDLFVQNFMFTRKLALDGALDEVGAGDSRKDVMSRIRRRTSELLESLEGQDIYSEEIRHEQMGEIEVLIGHYGSLLQAAGDDVYALVRQVYPTPAAYREFLARLREAEQRVALAARQSLGENIDETILQRLRDAADRVRAAAVERIYFPGA
jgi:hypothetical protein